MTAGPGKYDDLATEVRIKSGGELVVVAVVNGDDGTGFSIQSTNIELALTLPTVLRRMADSIEEDMKDVQD